METEYKNSDCDIQRTGKCQHNEQEAKHAVMQICGATSGIAFLFKIAA